MAPVDGANSPHSFSACSYIVHCSLFHNHINSLLGPIASFYVSPHVYLKLTPKLHVYARNLKSRLSLQVVSAIFTLVNSIIARFTPSYSLLLVNKSSERSILLQRCRCKHLNRIFQVRCLAEAIEPLGHY